MRKHGGEPAMNDSSVVAVPWLDLEHEADVDVTSEDAEHPIEAAFQRDGRGSWRAAEPGMQLVRLRFHAPQRVRRICLVFEERDLPRTQEFVLRWSGDGGGTCRDIVRQQYTFAPPNTIREVEDYSVALDGVTSLELHLTPDISRGPVLASLAVWMVA
jgi:hypothetical protein